MVIYLKRFLRPNFCIYRQSLSTVGSITKDGVCWSCGNDNGMKEGDNRSIMSMLFCENSECGKIQAVGKDVDYFDLLGVSGGKKKFLSSDTSDVSLEKAYKSLQKRLHPDLFSQKSLMEQEISASNSAIVNAAYQCLRNDIDRAGYILSKYHGIQVLSESGGSHHDAELNMVIFELREEIDELDYSDKPAVGSMVASLTTAREEIGKELHSAMEKEDAELMTREAVKLRYWVKMIEEVEERRAS